MNSIWTPTDTTAKSIRTFFAGLALMVVLLIGSLGCGTGLELATGSDAPEGGVAADYAFLKAGVFPDEDLTYPLDLEVFGYLVVVDLQFAAGPGELISTGAYRELRSTSPGVRYHLEGTTESVRAQVRTNVIERLARVIEKHDLERIRTETEFFRARGHGMTLTSSFVWEEVNHVCIDLFATSEQVNRNRFNRLSNDIYRRFSNEYGDRFYVDVLLEPGPDGDLF